MSLSTIGHKPVLTAPAFNGRSENTPLVRTDISRLPLGNGQTDTFAIRFGSTDKSSDVSGLGPHMENWLQSLEIDMNDALLFSTLETSIREALYNGDLEMAQEAARTLKDAFQIHGAHPSPDALEKLESDPLLPCMLQTEISAMRDINDYRQGYLPAEDIVQRIVEENGEQREAIASLYTNKLFSSLLAYVNEGDLTGARQNLTLIEKIEALFTPEREEGG